MSSKALIQHPPSAVAVVSTATKITVQCNCGFGNNLYIRGSGAGLSWDKGLLLRNVSPSEWIWESKVKFDTVECKIVLNDQNYEVGENHTIRSGTTTVIEPHFT